MEEELIQKKTHNFGEVNLQEFAQILRLDKRDPTTQQLFRIHDRVRTIKLKHIHVNKLIEEKINILFLQLGQGKIDLEEYIFTVLATANASSELDKVKIAFDVSVHDYSCTIYIAYKLLFLRDYIVS